MARRRGGPVGELVPRPRRRRHRGGDRRCRLTASSASSTREGDHVDAADGFVAIGDINPRADTHLLVIPERHVDTFREIGEFPADEAKRMLEFVAETARETGLEDYRVVVNVGAGGGQTIFHLHWHVLGGDDGDARMSLIARIEEELRPRCASATPSGATRCG